MEGRKKLRKCGHKEPVKSNEKMITLGNEKDSTMLLTLKEIRLQDTQMAATFKLQE